MLPREYPPWQTVYYHFRRWRHDGRLRRAHDRLREELREAEGRDRDPSAAVIDSQVVKTTPVGGPDAGDSIISAGRRRGAGTTRPPVRRVRLRLRRSSRVRRNGRVWR
jgi:transposase